MRATNWYCQSLEKIAFPSKITSISNYSFSGCTNLQSVTFNTSLTTIGAGAFSGCSNIENLDFPARISTINSNAFGGCSKLSIISVHNTTPPTISDNVFPTAVYWTAMLNVPSGTSSAYMSATGWKNFENVSEMESSDDDVKKYIISIGVSSGGIVEILSNTLSNTSLSASVKGGDDVVMNFTPNDGYELKSLVINGEEVVSKVANNSYTITSINQNTTIVVTFAELPIYLSIKSADNGTIAQEAEKGKTYSFTITPSEDWQIESVSFNGIDVTSQLNDNKYTTPEITANSELNVVYKQNEQSAVKAISQNSPVRVMASYGKLTVDNDGFATSLSVYATDGSKVASESIGIGTTSIELSTNKVYIVKVEGETFKVAM